jgi:hypothetical protein
VLAYDPWAGHQGTHHEHATQARSLQEGKRLANEVLTHSLLHSRKSLMYLGCSGVQLSVASIWVQCDFRARAMGVQNFCGPTVFAVRNRLGEESD